MSDGTLAGGHFGSVQNQGTVPGTVVSSISSGDTQLIVTNVAGVVTITQVISAGWDFDKCRVYALDGTNGNDANRGYADPTATGAAAYAVACAAAGLVAKKTWAGLAAIFPRLGRGRMVEIVVAAATYTESPELVLNGVEGYVAGCPTVRGTATDATAGSVAFAGTTADATFAGHVVVPSLNAAGYNAIGSPTTSVIQCQKVGGAVAGFGAAPALPDGTRIRFLSTTATVALRNVCRQVHHVSGTDTVSLQTALPAVPATGGSADTYVFEQPGVVVPAWTISGPGNGGLGMQLVGLRSTGAITIADARVRLTSVWSDTSITCNSTQLSSVASPQAYTHPVLGSLTAGGGVRAGTTSAFQGGQFVLTGWVTVSDTTILRPGSMQWGAGCAARSLSITDTWSNEGLTATSIPTVGITVAVGIPRLFGAPANGLVISGSRLRVASLNIDNTTSAAIQVNGRSDVIITAAVAGAGNTGVGLDLQNAGQSLVQVQAGALPTVTGTVGDIRMSSQALAAWSNSTFEELWDQAGNHIFQFNTNGAAYRATMSPSVYAGVVNNGDAINGYAVVAIQPSSSGQVKTASADTLVNASGVVGIMLASANNGAQCLYGGMGGYKVVLFDGLAAVTPGKIAYLSEAVGCATCTVPPVSVTKAKLRLGVVVDNSLPFNLAIVRMTPEMQPVLADGLP